MKQDYATQWFKLSGKCLAVIAALGFLVGFGAMVVAVILDPTKPAFSEVLEIGVLYAVLASLYAAIPVALFSTFIVTLRAFGRN